MTTTTTQQLKAMSVNTLEERLDAMCAILCKLVHDYKHAFDSQEGICLIVHQEIDNIVLELESREQ
jgi:hypothetical protein